MLGVKELPQTACLKKRAGSGCSSCRGTDPSPAAGCCCSASLSPEVSVLPANHLAQPGSGLGPPATSHSLCSQCPASTLLCAPSISALTTSDAVLNPIIAHPGSCRARSHLFSCDNSITLYVWGPVTLYSPLSYPLGCWGDLAVLPCKWWSFLFGKRVAMTARLSVEFTCTGHNLKPTSHNPRLGDVSLSEPQKDWRVQTCSICCVQALGHTTSVNQAKSNHSELSGANMNYISLSSSFLFSPCGWFLNFLDKWKAPQFTFRLFSQMLILLSCLTLNASVNALNAKGWPKNQMLKWGAWVFPSTFVCSLTDNNCQRFWPIQPFECLFSSRILNHPCS